MKSAIIEAAEYIERQCQDLDDRSMMNRARTASLRKLAKRLRAEAAIPAGWKPVPVEPTKEMLNSTVAMMQNVTISGCGGWTRYAQQVYRTMLSAAPEPPPASESSGWQPIETAPKDGSWVLLSGGRQSDTYWDDRGDLTWPGAAVCLWLDETESWKMGVVWDGDLRSNYDDPTHWMPLPAPPASEDSPSVEKSSVIRAPQRGGR